MFRKMMKKIKNSRLTPLMFAKGFVIHKQIKVCAISRINPMDELIRRERPFAPILVAKTKGDIIAQFIIFQKKTDVIGIRWLIHKVWTSPAKNRVPALCQNSFVAGLVGPIGKVVVVC